MKVISILIALESLNNPFNGLFSSFMETDHEKL